MDATTPGFVGSDAGDAPTPGLDHGEGEEEGEEGHEGEGDIDEELAAELDLALGDEEAEADDEEADEEEESEEEEDDDDDDEDDEDAQARKLLNEEIRDLEAAVAKKGSEIASSANPLIKVSILACYVICAADIHDAAEAIRGRVEEAASRPRHEARTARRDEGETEDAEGGYRTRRRRYRWHQ